MKKISDLIFGAMISIVVLSTIYYVAIDKSYIMQNLEKILIFLYFGTIAYATFYIKAYWIRLMMLGLFISSFAYVIYLKMYWS